MSTLLCKDHIPFIDNFHFFLPFSISLCLPWFLQDIFLPLRTFRRLSYWFLNSHLRFCNGFTAHAWPLRRHWYLLYEISLTSCYGFALSASLQTWQWSDHDQLQYSFFWHGHLCSSAACSVLDEYFFYPTTVQFPFVFSGISHGSPPRTLYFLFSILLFLECCQSLGFEFC